MEDVIQGIRQFNRFYTKELGLLDQHMLATKYSLTEIRVLYEIEVCGLQVSAKEIGNSLGLDKGYLSRLLKKLQQHELLTRTPSTDDARVSQLALTSKGKDFVREMSSKMEARIAQQLSGLSDHQKEALTESMGEIYHLLSGSSFKPEDIQYRSDIRPGDIGYMIHLHGVLYAKESQYDITFEGYVAKTFYDLVEQGDLSNHRIWLATFFGKVIGSIAIVHHSEKQAQLRWFLVHPDFRGAGIGAKLYKYAIDYCYEKAYEKVFLYTTDVQKKAVSMYKQSGFKLMERSPSLDWGQTMHQETYELIIQ